MTSTRREEAKILLLLIKKSYCPSFGHHGNDDEIVLFSVLEYHSCSIFWREFGKDKKFSPLIPLTTNYSNNSGLRAEKK